MSNVGAEVKLTSDGCLRRVHRQINRVAITTNGLLSLSWRVCGSSLSRLYLCKVWLTYYDRTWMVMVRVSWPVNFDSQSKVLQDTKACQRIKDQCDLQTVSSFVYEFVSCIACEKCQMIQACICISLTFCVSFWHRNLPSYNTNGLSWSMACLRLFSAKIPRRSYLQVRQASTAAAA